MDDPCELICVAQAAAVDAAAETAGTFIATFNATTPEDPSAELERETQDLRVMFIPYSDEETKIGRCGEAYERFTTSMLVVRKRSDEFTRRVMGKLVRQIRGVLRGQAMAGYRYVGAETASKFDLDQLHDRRQYVSIVRFTYQGTTHTDAA